MLKDLNKVYIRLEKALNVNFSKPVKLNGIVYLVNISKKYFVMYSIDGNNFIECYTNEDISKFKEKDNVMLEGWIRFKRSPTVNKVCIIAKYVYKVSEKNKYEKNIKIYRKIESELNKDKCKNVIKKITSLNPPKMVLNVGLLVLPDNEDNIDNFKIMFQERCFGKLFIYRFKNDTISSSLQIALEYFKKYHNIDMICFLTNKLNLKYICNLSSKTNVKYMINRKNCPYVLSITSPNKDKTNMDPLTVMLSNSKVDGITACVDFIHNIQITFKKRLEFHIQKGFLILNGILNKYKNKIFEYKMYFVDLVEPKFLQTSTNSQIEKIKILLVKKLNCEKAILKDIKINLMQNIIDDSRVQEFFDKHICSERKHFNNINQLIPTNSITNDSTTNFKKIVLQQYEYFQEHPEYISQAINKFDELVSEMIIKGSNSKKIEIKSSNYTTEDTINVKIKRDNGDF